MTRVRRSFLLPLALVLAGVPARAHNGGLDSLGCHHDRKHGGYHCHEGPLAGRSFMSEDDARQTLNSSSVRSTGDQAGGGRGVAPISSPPIDIEPLKVPARKICEYLLVEKIGLKRGSFRFDDRFDSLVTLPGIGVYYKLGKTIIICNVRTNGLLEIKVGIDGKGPYEQVLTGRITKEWPTAPDDIWKASLQSRLIR